MTTERPIVTACIDVCTMCQLNCRGCFMRKFDHGARKRGYLTHENFIKFLDLNPDLKWIEIANLGEVFLNPDLVKIMRTAHERGIALDAYTSTNFNTVSDEQIDALVRYKFHNLTISIDGCDQESYSWYRRNGNYDTVIANIKKLNAKKKELDSNLPNLKWQYIIFPSNHKIEQIRKAKEIAKSLGMDIYFIKDWDGFVPDNAEEIEKETGLSFKDDKLSSVSKKEFIPCTYLWTRPQINWNGKFFGCCSNLLFGDFGLSAFEMPIKEFLKHYFVKNTQKMLTGGDECPDSPCSRCYMYEKFKNSGKFPTEEEMMDPWWKDEA